MMQMIIGSFAEFERTMLRERTKIGLNTAPEKGVLAADRESRLVNRRPRSRWKTVARLSAGRTMLGPVSSPPRP
jgi:DNA invertase Pin-like site-specific DNA recombinase